MKKNNSGKSPAQKNLAFESCVKTNEHGYADMANVSKNKRGPTTPTETPEKTHPEKKTKVNRMENSSKEEYTIQSFDLETQKLLKTALKDPGSVDLEKVSSVIVDQSLKDLIFSREAGRICYTIVQAEAKQTNGNVFRRNLLNRLQQEFKAREEIRKRSTQEWVCLVSFICNVFDYLKVNNMPMMALVHPVYDCLFRLAQSDALKNEEEVDCLVLQLHRIGDQLEKMNLQLMDELFNLLRDGFLLQEDLSSMGRLLLLEILEFRAGGWTLDEMAQKYYYSEVTD
ncbi:MIF4G domain-containing protein B-like isoform X1 [Carassius auratus]|uniref:MIF4G domain-containing protein B-like isoform X1 n=2 Tax=Carassius auratus TaxID=7957 RepID=A0A6P6MI24_CARAU|nr:MIF4G domain-containing protein B-like isoform X1 [Carassius auratus]